MSVPHSLREQGWCSGESTHLPPMQLMFDSRTHDIMWVEFVLVHVLALSILDFPLLKKHHFQIPIQSGLLPSTLLRALALEIAQALLMLLT